MLGRQPDPLHPSRKVSLELQVFPQRLFEAARVTLRLTPDKTDPLVSRPRPALNAASTWGPWQVAGSPLPHQTAARDAMRASRALEVTPAQRQPTTTQPPWRFARFSGTVSTVLSVSLIARTLLVAQLCLLACAQTTRNTVTEHDAGAGGAAGQGAVDGDGSDGSSTDDTTTSDANASIGGAMSGGGSTTDSSGVGSGGTGGNCSDCDGGTGGGVSGGAGDSGEDPCDDGATECVDDTTARFCDGGTWRTKACEASDPFTATCHLGKCEEECAEGLTACGDSCFDTDRTSNHCGACDLSCGNAECVTGRCQPEVLVDEQVGAHSLAVTPSGSSVFWITDFEVRGCPSSGCSGPPLVLANEGSTVSRPYSIAADEGRVYWASDISGPNTFSCPLAGCAEATPQRFDSDVVLDSVREVTVGDLSGTPHVVFVNRFNSTLCTTTATTICSSMAPAGDQIQSVAIDETDDFWLEHQASEPGLKRRPRDKSATMERLTAVTGTVVRIQTDTVFVMAQDSIYSSPKTASGGFGTDFVTAQTGLTSMVVNANGVYWTVSGEADSANGAIRTCPLSGCPDGGPLELAAGQAQPTSLHIVGGFAYWLNRNVPGAANANSIMRISISQ